MPNQPPREALELLREKLLLDQQVGRESTQLLLEGDIIVPDVKPDMAQVLQTDAKVSITRTEPAADRVNFMGKLAVQVLYIAKGPEKSVHSMAVIVPIDDFLRMEGVHKDVYVEAKASIANLDYKMLNDRKISYRAVVNVSLQAEDTTVHDVVVDIRDIPENQLLKTSISVNRTVENKQDHFTIKEEIQLPSNKPCIREVLEAGVQIANKDVRVQNGRVLVSGELLLTTLYKADAEGSLVEFVENEIPFHGSLDVSGARDGMFADAVLAIQEQNVLPRPDADGEERLLDAEVTVAAAVKVYNTEELQVLEDAYAINQTLDLAKSAIRYPRLICRNRNQFPVKEIVSLDEDCPDILQIFRVQAEAQLDDLKVIEDKLIVEGVIRASILYVAEDDATPLYAHQVLFPYKQVIEAKGAAAGMDVTIDVSVDHISFNMLSQRETELRFMLAFNAQVMEAREMNVIHDISFQDLSPEWLSNLPSMSVYVVQPGDSLWKIAKKYNTPLDELLELNEIENPDRIYPGQKLLILKKVV